MLAPQPVLPVHVRWRAAAPADEGARARVVAELEQASWTLSQIEALLFEAHQQAAGAQHAWLLPRMELRLPLYDLGLRYRLSCTLLESPLWTLEDEKGRRVADVRLP